MWHASGHPSCPQIIGTRAAQRERFSVPAPAHHAPRATCPASALKVRAENADSFAEERESAWQARLVHLECASGAAAQGFDPYEET